MLFPVTFTGLCRVNFTIFICAVVEFYIDSRRSFLLDCVPRSKISESYEVLVEFVIDLLTDGLQIVILDARLL
jgi:hypothetical protein